MFRDALGPALEAARDRYQAEAIDTAALDAQQLAEEELAAKARSRGDLGEI